MESPKATPKSKETDKNLGKKSSQMVRKNRGTIYDPVWYFLSIFVVFFMFWLRTETIVIRNAYLAAIPELTLDELKRFEWLWIAVVACIMTTVMILKLINHFFLG